MNLRRPGGLGNWLGWALGGALAVLLGVGSLWVAGIWPSPPRPPAIPPTPEEEDDVPDPLGKYAGPFLNVRPGVQYVGSARCARCHKDKAATYKDHPMGRALTRVGATTLDHGLGTDHNNPFEAFGARLRVSFRDGRTWHLVERLDEQGEVVASLAFEALFAIGSGTKGQSFLTVRDGFLYQTPISWYRQKGIWDLSPGFRSVQLAGRPVLGECLFCHANRVREVPGEPDRFGPGVFDGHAIGCERCHGPGELHAKQRNEEMLLERPDRTIVNPRHLEPRLREAVCEQCHLEGEERVVRRGRGLYDFRPGMPLEDFWSVFVASPDGKTRRAVGHVEQMYASKCFEKSKAPNKLGCTSCHDPHVHVGPDRPQERVNHYRAACLKCHDPGNRNVDPHARSGPPLAERRKTSPQDSCVDCHMPRYGASDIAHTASTDHRVLRRRPAGPGREAEGPASHGLVLFRQEGLPLAEQDRDLGVALAAHGLNPATAARALTLLTQALKRAPNDLTALELKGNVLAGLGRYREAREALEAVLRRAPKRRQALLGAALAAQSTNDPEAALGYWRRAIELDPGFLVARRGYATLLAERGRWAEADEQARAWLKLDPLSVPARQVRARCLLRQGKTAEAQAEMVTIRRLRPPNIRQVEAWFADQTR